VFGRKIIIVTRKSVQIRVTLTTCCGWEGTLHSQTDWCILGTCAVWAFAVMLWTLLLCC